MPLPYNQIPSSSPWDRKLGFSTPLPPMSPKKAGHLVGLYHICIYCTDLSFLTSSPYLQKHFCLCDERRNGTACFSPFVIKQPTAEYISESTFWSLTYKQECRKRKSFELYQYYKLGTYLTVDKHTHVWLSALKSNANVHWGHSLDQRSTNTTNTTISSSIPLPRPYLYQPIFPPNHLHYFTKDLHHLYFLSTWFVYYCDIWIYVSIINIYFTRNLNTNSTKNATNLQW